MADRFIQVYEDYADKHNAAYDSFRRTYEKENPIPVKPGVERDSWFVLLALVMIVGASVIVSGSRTVEEFGGGVIGAAAFAMLEIGIVTYAFFRTKTGMDKERVADVRKMAQRGLALAFVVAVAANIHDVLRSNDTIVSENVNTIINLLVAISAPTLAFISGDVMALELLRNRQRQREVDDRHQANMIVWNDGSAEAWKRQRTNWGVKIQVENRPMEIPALSNGISSGSPLETTIPAETTLGHRKEPDATRKAWEHLTANAGVYLTWKKSDLVKQVQSIGVGKSTAYKVVTDFLAQSDKSVLRAAEQVIEEVSGEQAVQD